MNLNQVTLPARDVARSAEFYRRLGFTQIVSNLPQYVRFECGDGEATFSLNANDICNGKVSFAGFSATAFGAGSCTAPDKNGQRLCTVKVCKQ